MAWAKLIFGWTVIIVAVVVVILEVVGRSVAERAIEDQIHASGVSGDVDVTLGRSWWQPSVVGVVLFDSLDQVEVKLSDVDLYSTRIEDADYVLKNLRVDVSFRKRTARIESLGSGTVRVRLNPSVFTGMVGLDTSIRSGRMYLAGSDEPLDLRVKGANLAIGGDAVRKLLKVDSVDLPVVDPQILPCTPRVGLVGHLVELTCTGDRLPGLLSAAIGAGSGTGNGPGSSSIDDLPPVDQSEIPPPATLEIPPSSTPRKGSSGSHDAPKPSGGD